MLDDLADRLADWPLLLNLAHGRIARRVRSGRPLIDVLSAAMQALEISGLTAFDHKSASVRNDAAAISLDLSLEALTETEGPDARDRLLDLAVFVEDADIPVALILDLWASISGLDALSGEDLLDRMDELSFFQRYEIGAGVLTLHDVIRTWLRSRAGAERLSCLDRALAGVIAERAGPDWLDLAHDDYSLRHHLAHLAAGCGRRAANDVLIDPRWLQATATGLVARGLGLSPLVAGAQQQAETPLALDIARALALIAHEVPNDHARSLVPLLCGHLGETLGEDGRTSWRTSTLRPALFPQRGSLRSMSSEVLKLSIGSHVGSVAFSPDGTRLATGSNDGTARIWSIALEVRVH